VSLNHWRTALKIGAILSVTMILIVQLTRWQGFAFGATYLQSKSLFIPLNQKELQALGSMCNSLENYACSEHYFEELVHRFPKHRIGLANLGIVLARSGKFAKARIALTRYFRSGGRAYDAMFWMGKTLTHLSQNKRALHWYYQALSQAPEKMDIASELIDQLMSLGRFEEALSVLASTTRGKPSEDPFWKAKLSGLQTYISQAEQAKKGTRYKIRLPALDGKHHFVPVKPDSSSDRYQFFLLDQRVSDISVTEEFVLGLPSQVSEKLGRLKSQGGSIDSLRIRLPTMKVGPWELQDVEVRICSNCQPRLGKAILDKLDLEKTIDESVQFALLTKR
jgi:tetratricopeptide (TPR) repeat protein